MLALSMQMIRWCHVGGTGMVGEVTLVVIRRHGEFVHKGTLVNALWGGAGLYSTEVATCGGSHGGVPSCVGTER